MRPMDLGRAGRAIDPHDNVLATSRDPNSLAAKVRSEVWLDSDRQVFKFGSGSREAEQGPLIVPGERQA